MLEAFDKSLLLWLNSFHAPFFDGLMWAFSRTDTWLLFFTALLVTLMKGRDKCQQLLLILAIVLLIVFTDQVSAHVIKPYFQRLRPSHQPDIAHMVHLVRGYKGGLYGFVSSHAANTFGLATFLSLVFRRRMTIIMLFLWALLCSYSRIYLGVHFPGDILCGGILGVFVAFAIYRMLTHFKELTDTKPSQNLLIIGFFLSLLFAFARGIAFLFT